ncbi:hypothetical protein QYF36_003977 [Acer negundo]|nr:hypothetical protein QYF36_003977 [Acer negundo]
MDSVASKQDFIRGKPMHTDTVAGHSNLSSRKKIFAVLYAGTDITTLYLKKPPLNRKYRDKFWIATEIMKINEEHDLEWLVVGRSWISTGILTGIDYTYYDSWKSGLQQRNEWSSESLVVDIETKSKELEFLLDNLGNMRLHWKI